SNNDMICMLIQIGGDGGGGVESATVSDLTIDSGSFTTVGTGAISINAGSADISVERVTIVNMSQFGISVSNSNKWNILENHIINSIRPQKDGKYTQIEAIIVADGTESQNGLIAKNTLRGAAMDISAHDSIVTDNIISDWTFGAGITTEQSKWC